MRQPWILLISKVKGHTDWVELSFCLRDDGNFDLSCFPLYRNGLFGFLEPLDVRLDGILGHGPRVTQVFAFGDKPGQGRNCDRVPAILVGFEKGSVFVEAFLDGLHGYILN